MQSTVSAKEIAVHYIIMHTLMDVNMRSVKPTFSDRADELIAKLRENGFEIVDKQRVTPLQRVTL